MSQGLLTDCMPMPALLMSSAKAALATGVRKKPTVTLVGGQNSDQTPSMDVPPHPWQLARRNGNRMRACFHGFVHGSVGLTVIRTNAASVW